MKKYFENKTWLLELSNCDVAFNIILHRKQDLWFWFRYGKLGRKYITIEVGKKTIVNLNF
jgi:hypothetical protein